jgi:hypothetical protein
MKRSPLLPLLLASLFVFTLNLNAQEKDRSIRTRTKGLQKLDGYMPLYWDAENGKLLLEIERFNAEFLYQVSLPTGIGSNPIGLDRGQLGSTNVVFFERTGQKVLLVRPNYRYRAITNDPQERRAVEESFARSVLWGFKVEATEEARVLVDATAFFMRDAHGVIETLRRANQGRFGLDETRSSFYLARTKNFPQNTEVETQLTFTGDEPGRLVRETVPTPQAITVREHHSFVALPDANYKPRRLDPRVGVMGVEFYDYASAFTEPIEKRWINRHRLQKKDPNAAVSEPVKPIIYYVDSGAPEPIRSALVEGASWWNEAFEAAGFKNAFQVKLLPPDADPMDVRYNMINWVHRSTRGWSYGGSIEDPRTGEIIKGNVTLGSLRVRQDFMLGTGMIPPYSASRARQGEAQQGDAKVDAGGSSLCELGMMSVGDDDYLTQDASNDSSAMSLARIRQLSAHEVGHTLGLAHNFAASTYAGRGSVMDYPAPLVEIRDGKLDFSNAYARGIGAYDKFAITYAYAQFPAGADESVQLERILEDGIGRGMLFISDADARPLGAAHPLANLWDNGDDPIKMLKHEMEVRRIGLAQFGLGNIPDGTPLSMLEAKFLPLYLHHRYQLQAAVKSVGGLYYTYAVKRTTRTALATDRIYGTNPARVQEIVAPARQREALNAVLDTLRPDSLAIPPRILALIPPRAFGYEGGTGEYFANRTDPAFDPIAAATIAADLAILPLVEPHRAARLNGFHALNAANPNFKQVLDALIARTWLDPAPRDTYQAAIARAVQSLTVTRLMDTAANADAAPQVRADATEALRELNERLKLPVADAATGAHRRATRDDIERFLARPDASRKQTAPLAIPQGDPIGGGIRQP